MRTVKLLIAYDGSGYCGWQRQENGPTIQQELERAVSLICNASITVHGAGRTDAGVHALGMTAHFRTGSRVECTAFHRGLNSLLPDDIRILDVADEKRGFHARYSALGKTYRYSLFTGAVLCPTRRLYTTHVPYDLSPERVTQCLSVIRGTHDFSSFETAGSRDKDDTTGRGAERTIFRAELTQPETGWLDITLTGDGFLRHMVRNLVGTIIEVARTKRSVPEFTGILNRRDRTQAGATAPAQGLTLLKVHYSRDWHT